MPSKVTCPGCQAPLRIPDTLTDPVVTCPRCLAEVQNPAPGAAAPATPPREPATATTDPESFPCPRCGKPVKNHWRYCPFCERRLTGKAPSEGPSVDGQVRGDLGAVGCGILVLALLGAFGLSSMVVSLSLPAAAAGSDNVFPLLIFACFLGLLGLGLYMRFGGQGSGARGIGRVIVGSFAVAGVILAGTLLVGIALAIVLLAVCFAGLGGRGGRW